MGDCPHRVYILWYNLPVSGGSISIWSWRAVWAQKHTAPTALMPDNYPWVLTDLSSGPHFAAEFPPMLNTHSWTGISQHITHALQMCEGPIKANQKMKWEQKVIMCNHPQWHLLLQTPNNQQWWYNALLKQKESPVCVVSPESLMYWHANGDATPSHISSLNYLHVSIKWFFLVCKTYIFLSQHPVGNLKI